MAAITPTEGKLQIQPSEIKSSGPGLHSRWRYSYHHPRAARLGTPDGESLYRTLHQYIGLRVVSQLKYMFTDLAEIPFTVECAGAIVMLPYTKP